MASLPPMEFRLHTPVAPALGDAPRAGPSWKTGQAAGEFLYVANVAVDHERDGTERYGECSISEYRIASDGWPWPRAPVSVRAGSGRCSLVPDPAGTFLYALSEQDDAIRQYRIGPDGCLSPLQPASIRTGRTPRSMAIDPTGRFAYVWAMSDGLPFIYEYRISGNGVLVPLQPAMVYANHCGSHLVARPDARFLYAVGSEIVPLRIGPFGVVQPVAGAAAFRIGPDGTPLILGFSADGKSACVLGEQSGAGQVVAAGADGSLAARPGGILELSGSVAATVVSPAGDRAYVCGTGSTTIVACPLVGGQGAGPACVVAPPQYGGISLMVADPTGRYLYVVAGDLFPLRIGRSGALSRLSPGCGLYVRGAGLTVSMAVAADYHHGGSPLIAFRLNHTVISHGQGLWLDVAIPNSAGSSPATGRTTFNLSVTNDEGEPVPYTAFGEQAQGELHGGSYPGGADVTHTGSTTHYRLLLSRFYDISQVSHGIVSMKVALPTVDGRPPSTVAARLPFRCVDAPGVSACLDMSGATSSTWTIAWR